MLTVLKTMCSFVHIYHENGSQIESHYDDNGDGVAESITMWVYNSDFNVIEERNDDYGDDTRDSIYTYN